MLSKATFLNLYLIDYLIFRELITSKGSDRRRKTNVTQQLFDLLKSLGTPLN